MARPFISTRSDLSNKDAVRQQRNSTESPAVPRLRSANGRDPGGSTTGSGRGQTADERRRSEENAVAQRKRWAEY
jgi:hypothetical protein